jgi:PEP-CTERM motif-containing protein
MLLIRKASFLAAVAAGLVGLSSANASIVATRFPGTGTTIADGDNSIAGQKVTASNIVNQANWQDDGGTGNPNDFNAGNGFPDNPIPGDVIGVDEDNWTVVGSGVLKINTTGDYKFRAGSDDSGRIILNGRNVVVLPGCCANVDGVTLHLTAGSTHMIQTIVKEGAGGGNGEFSISKDGGAFTLIGSGVSADYTVSPNLPSPARTSLGDATAGLTAKIFANAHATQNQATDAFLATHPAPNSTSTITSAATGALPPDTVVTVAGFLRIDAADDIAPDAPGIQVKFRLDTDDNGRLSIAGLTVMENDGGHGTGHFLSTNTDTLDSGTGDNAAGTAVVSFEGPGYYDLSAYVHNGGSGGSGTILSSIGLSDGTMQQIPDDRLFVPEPASMGVLAIGGIGVLARRRRRSLAGR